MPYHDDIPAADTTRKATQPLLLENFIAIKQAFEIQHTVLNPANQGKHTFIPLPIPAVTPTAHIEGLTLFTKISPYTGLIELAYRREANNTTHELSSYTTTVPGVHGAYNAWAMLPGNMLMKWGSVQIPGSNNGNWGPQTFTYPVGPTTPAFIMNPLLMVTMERFTAGGGASSQNGNIVTLLNATNLSFIVKGYRAAVGGTHEDNFAYLAIGRVASV